jgi:membrane fusion protein (multidrug efflux system)
MKTAICRCFLILLTGAAFETAALAQSYELTPVVERSAARTIDLPGEIQPFLSVALHARVNGYVERALVDRGSTVKEGQLLMELSAPEMKAQIAEAESKVQSAEADRVQAEAQLAAVQATFGRLTEAAKTPGAVAGNELDLAGKQVDAAKAMLNSRQHASQAAQASLDAVQAMESYLKVTAPFDGMVTTRFVHPGALVGPNTNVALLEIQQISKLRLVVPVPEENVGGIARGAKVSFSVPAWPGRAFSGAIARIPSALDEKTRSMPVELDVLNRDELLAPGMYATVKWMVRSADQALFVPKTSVVTTTERTFVIREKAGRAEWVDVRKGTLDGDLIQVMGPLAPGDKVVKRGTDEIREGTPLKPGTN